MDKNPITNLHTPSKDSFKELKKDIFNNAKDHGWHDKYSPDTETMLLLLSEVTEALEDYRNGHDITEIWYEDDGKPCGIPTELADICIRLWEIQEFKNSNKNDDPPDSKIGSLPDKHIREISKDFISALGLLSTEIVNLLYPYVYVRVYPMIDILVFYIAQKYGIDLWDVILIKHRYNKTRPYRHGGKVC